MKIDITSLLNLNNDDEMKAGVIFIGIGVALVFISIIERRNETND